MEKSLKKIRKNLLDFIGKIYIKNLREILVHKYNNGKTYRKISTNFTKTKEENHIIR